MTKIELLSIITDMQSDGSDFPSISDEDYALIEKVYTFHPSISEVDGKRQIAYLYVTFGFAIIKDMEARADMMAERERQYLTLKSSLDELKKEMDDIRSGRYIQEVF